jgi:hypothetical protein
MRNHFIKSSVLAVMLTLGMASNCFTAPESSLKYPKRMVRGRAVDLTPLFQWWAHKEQERPLTSWAHISGAVIATNSLGWVIKGQAQGGGKGDDNKKDASAETFVLKNPPLAERGEFEHLLTEQKSLNEERARVLGLDAQAKSQEDSFARQKNVNRHYRIKETTQLRNTRKETKGSAQEVETQLQEVKKKLAAFPNAEHFVVEDFALRTGEKLGACPVYDRGIPIK